MPEPDTMTTQPTIYRFAWGNNGKRRALKDRRCVIEATGALSSVQVCFLDDDSREILSRRALRAVRDAAPMEPDHA